MCLATLRNITDSVNYDISKPLREPGWKRTHNKLKLLFLFNTIKVGYEKVGYEQTLQSFIACAEHRPYKEFKLFILHGRSLTPTFEIQQ